MQPCVIDSCSLLHSFHIQVGGQSLNSLIADHFDISLHRTVVDEMNSVLARAYASWRERQLVSDEISEIRRNHAQWTATRCCHESLDSEQALLEQESLGRLDRGEIDCIALAKAKSDEHVRYVLFVTDDYDAGEAARGFFDKYQIGNVVRSADLISFFGLRYKLAKPEIHQGLRNLISFYTSLYELVLSEVQNLLPGGISSYVFPLVREGDFPGAIAAINRLSITQQTRQRLRELLEEVASLSAEQSVLAHTLSRLRSLANINQ
jgi:hypothetical protein